MVGVIAQAVTSMISKKKARMTSEAADGESEESEAMPFSAIVWSYLWILSDYIFRVAFFKAPFCIAYST